MTTFESEFALGDRVYADGCDDLIMIVTALQWRCTRVQVECSWMSGGAHTAWIEPWRLTKVEPQ
jgi:hypothetical protein